MDSALQNTTAYPATQTQQSYEGALAGQSRWQDGSSDANTYGNTYIDGSGLTILGNVGTIVQPQPEHDSVAKFGLCLGSAPRIDPTDFVGRAVEIEEISQALEPGTVCTKQRRVILGGIGGIGKTQLAIAYAERHQESYHSIFWLNATSELTLHRSLRLVAAQLVQAHYLETLSDDQVLSRVHKWLSNPQNTRWLLIFDNYDEPAQFDISRYCPYAGHGSIVITTRLPDHVQLSSKRIRLQVLSDMDEGLDLLQRRSRRPDVKHNPDAHLLVRRLAGLPLALATAGAYLAKTASVTFQQYLHAYEQRWNRALQRSIPLQEYQNRTLYTTWDISYALLMRDDPDAARMLRLLAYFDNQGIWYELLHAGTGNDLPAWLQTLLHDRMTLESVMSTLVDYCFVEVHRPTSSYSMHNCVHDWTITTLNKTVDRQAYWYSFNCVAESINPDDWGSYGHLGYARLTPHAVRLVDAWVLPKLLLDDVKTDRTRQGLFIASLLHAQLQLPAAELMYRRLLATVEEAMPSDHSTALDIVNYLGIVYQDQGKLDKAEQMYARALAEMEKVLGLEYPSTLNTVNHLGILNQTQGKLDEAEQMYARVLVRDEKELGPNYIATFNTINNLMFLYRSRGRLDEAEQMLLRVLAGKEKLLGLDDASTLRTVYNLGLVYHDKGMLDEAERMYTRALAGQEKALGLEHPSTLNTVNNLARLYYDQGKLAEAGQMYKQALAGQEKAFGLEHPATLKSRRRLANLYSEGGNLD